MSFENTVLNLKEKTWLLPVSHGLFLLQVSGYLDASCYWFVLSPIAIDLRKVALPIAIVQEAELLLSSGPAWL